MLSSAVLRALGLAADRPRPNTLSSAVLRALGLNL